jgi:hypothetical protein
MNCYSTDGERFDFDSLEEAAEDVWNNTEACIGMEVTIYVGEKVSHQASDFLPYIAENMLDNAYDKVGDCSESWELSGVEGREMEEAVRNAVDAWATQYDKHPKFYSVANVRPIDVTFADLSPEGFLRT